MLPMLAAHTQYVLGEIGTSAGTRAGTCKIFTSLFFSLGLLSRTWIRRRAIKAARGVGGATATLAHACVCAQRSGYVRSICAPLRRCLELGSLGILFVRRLALLLYVGFCAWFGGPCACAVLRCTGAMVPPSVEIGAAAVAASTPVPPLPPPPAPPLVGLVRPLAEPVLLRLGGGGDDVGAAGLLVAAVIPVLLGGCGGGVARCGAV